MAKPQKDGYNGMRLAQQVLMGYGHSVSRAGAHAPFDLLVDGVIRVEVKTCNGAHDPEATRHIKTGTRWFFNLHRHGQLNEADVDIYILRFENIPEFKYALHALLRAPANEYTINANIRTLIGNPVWAKRFSDFRDFVSTPKDKMGIWRIKSWRHNQS